MSETSALSRENARGELEVAKAALPSRSPVGPAPKLKTLFFLSLCRRENTSIKYNNWTPTKNRGCIFRFEMRAQEGGV